MKNIFTFLLACIAVASFQQSRAQGMVLYYQFNGNTNDSTVSANNGTPNSMTYTNDIAGLPNKAGSFDGTTSYVSVPTNWVSTVPGKLIFSFWFKTSNHTKPAGIAYAGLKAIGNTPTNFTPIMWIDVNGKLCSFIYDGTASCLTTTDTINDDKWHHAVFHFSKFPIMINNLLQEIWLDGKIAATRLSTQSGVPNYSYMYVGTCNASGFNGMPNQWSYFRGTIDEVSFYYGDAGASFFHNLDLMITEHPQSQAVSTGANVSLHISRTNFNTDSTYTYQWYKDGQVYTGAGNTDSVITISNFTVTDTGSYTCMVTNSNNFKMGSEAGKLTMAPVGINVVSIEKGMRLYPNPAQNILNVDAGTKQGTIQVMGVNGMVYKTEAYKKGTKAIDISTLPAGIYNITLMAGDNLFTERFTKQ